MSKLVVSTIETQNIKYDSDTTSMTINSTGFVTGGYLKPSTEGLVTTTAGQNNIQFTVPSGCNRIEMQIYKFNPVNSEEIYIRMGNPSILTSGYEAVAIYEPTAGSGVFTNTTNAFRQHGFTAADNIHNFQGFGWSIDDGRRWQFIFEGVNTQYITNHLTLRGLIDMGSGQTLQKLEISSSGSGGFEAGALARVYYGKI